MSILLPNRFEVPQDGWYQISALGEFKHNPTGLVQIIDPESCRLMVERFREDSAQPNFPGILIDFDHFSLEQDKPSEAAGWIVALEERPGGLWAQIRWSDKGEEAVRGGRYRFISPVFRQDECEDLGNNRVKPRRLVNAAVTNDPNISGMVPLSNKKTEKPAAAAEGEAFAPMLIPLGSRDRALLNRALYLANWGGGPTTEEQRRAMFARMGGARRPSITAAQARRNTRRALSAALGKNVVLTDVSPAAFDRPAGSTAQRDPQTPMADWQYRERFGSSLPPSFAYSPESQPLPQIPTAPGNTISIPRFRSPSSDPYRAPGPTQPIGIAAPRKPFPTPQRPIFNVNPPPLERVRALLAHRAERSGHLANWRGGYLTDEQRKAMFARLSGGGGGGAPAYRAPDYSTSRDSDARIEVLEQQRRNILASIPPAPEPLTFDLIDTRQLERDLIRQNMSWSDIRAQVQAAEDHNQSVRAHLGRIKDQIKAKYKDPKKQKAAFQAYLDKVAEQNARAKDKHSQLVQDAQDKINKLDAAIALERVRKKEAEAEEGRREGNFDTQQENRELREAIRAAIAEDKAEAKAEQKRLEEEAERNSPEYKAAQEKKRVAHLKRIWRDAANGDETAVIRGLAESGVDPATVDIPGMIKEATSIGVLRRDATWQQRQQARQDRANAYNRPIPGTDGEPIQLVPRSFGQYQDESRPRGMDASPSDFTRVTEESPESDFNHPRNTLYRQWQEIDSDIKRRNASGALPDWQAKNERARAWALYQRRLGELDAP